MITVDPSTHPWMADSSEECCGNADGAACKKVMPDDVVGPTCTPW